MKIRDRIKDFRRVKASDLLPNPRNWRTHSAHQRDALKGILSEVGFADAVLARETPDGLMLIDGHLRTEEMGSAKVPVLVLDVTEDEANKLLAVADPLAGMAEVDAKQLDALLREVQTGSEALQELLGDLYDGAALDLEQGSALDGEREDKRQQTLDNMGMKVRPVLRVEDVQLFEMAVLATGIKDRGKAVMEICRAYLHEKG